MWNKIIAYIRGLPANEPVILGQTVSGILTVAVMMGLHASPGEIVAVASATTFVAGFVRSLVSPSRGA